MRLVNGFIGAILAFLAIAHGSEPDCLPLSMAYAGGAVLAALSLLQVMSIAVARVLAVITTAAMFFYFAGFFSMAPALHADWYMGSAQAWEALSLLLAAFTMIPVLSTYSCALKADCRHVHGQRREAQRTGFFSVPDNL